MDAHKLALGLSELRRELEEVRALLNGSVHHDSSSRRQRKVRSESISAKSITRSEPSEADPSDECDQLFNDALVAVTEFGQATPGILQMWLSIDYDRALRILNQLEAQRLVSVKGKVRQKAYELRGSS